MVIRDITSELVQATAEYPVVTILGPRQSGKTTLAQMHFSAKAYRSLETPDVRAAAMEDPRGFLKQMGNGGILDEVQRFPELLSYVQGIVDEKRTPGRFILTGSHQPQLHEAISQSLAGRTAMLTLWPYSNGELRQYEFELDPYELIVSGCYPELHEKGLDPRRFFNGYLQTYVERDVRALVELRDLTLFQKFLTLLAGRVGQVVNLTLLGNDVGVSRTTIGHWISVLKASFVLFELPPYYRNIGKRVIKSPKLYFTDVGLAAFLLGIHTAEQASRDPLRGGLYENLILTQVLKGALNRGLRPDIYFYRDSHGNEVDLVIREAGRILPVEIKSGATYTNDYLKGLSNFQKLGLVGTEPGYVLYNGDAEHSVHGVSLFNPLQVDDLWGQLVNQNT